MTVRICHLWPDALSWNGSGGNLLCLKKRLEWRGVSAEISEAVVGATVDFTCFDMVYIGSGKAAQNIALMRDVSAKSAELREFAENGGVILGVCEGFELLGREIILADGFVERGLGILDMVTRYKEDRVTGNAIFEMPSGKVACFENHAGRVELGKNVQPWGSVIKGNGNNGIDNCVGARYKNVYGCQAHGPLLPKNPNIADELIQCAISKYNTDALNPLDDTLEYRAQAAMLNR